MTFKGTSCRSKVRLTSIPAVPERCGERSSCISENRRVAAGHARFALFRFRDPGALVACESDVEGVPAQTCVPPLGQLVGTGLHTPGRE